MGNFPIFPEQASTFANQVDTLYFTLIGLALLFAVPVAVLIIYFAIRYRRGANVDRADAVSQSTAIEITWIAVPLFLALGVFTWGARLYVHIYDVPATGMDVYVVAKQWMWKVQHPTGQREIDELHVPVGEPVRLTMISQDVIHSFYVPAFRLKRDVLPGRYTTAWFQATKPGAYHLFCAEYCGTDHSVMRGTIVVMEPRQYQQWLSGRPTGVADVIPEDVTAAGQAPQSMAAAGEILFQRFGCSVCHRPDGNGVGPSLVGLLGSQVELENGQTVLADIQYIRDSILDPHAQIVNGYSAIMPTFQGQINEDELLQLVEYIAALGQEPGASQ
ncbi:MAG: cytochrome c oxidase subunit II [Caldilineaceae bacterium]